MQLVKTREQLEQEQKSVQQGKAAASTASREASDKVIVLLLDASMLQKMHTSHGLHSHRKLRA